MYLLIDHRKRAIFLDNVRVPGDYQGRQVANTSLEQEHGGGDGLVVVEAGRGQAGILDEAAGEGRPGLQGGGLGGLGGGGCEQRGEGEFRVGEMRVIARLLKEKDIVLATGGGAFINLETRAMVKAEAVSVWLKADIDVLFERVSRRSNRPLLKTADPKGTLEKLIAERYPIYQEADITVISRDVPQDQVAGDVVTALLDHFKTQQA